MRQLPLTDWELVRQARDGDQAAFHELVDRHARTLFGLAFSLVGNSADAEDVVQETLLGAYRGLAGFRQEASVKTWLARILVRQAAGHFRKEHRHKAISRDGGQGSQDGPEIDDPPVPSSRGQTDFQMDFNAALAALSPEHREVIVLREVQDMSYEEIAAILDLPAGTVESRLFRARRQLQELLKEYLP